jgi:hypothetical protein
MNLNKLIILPLLMLIVASCDIGEDSLSESSEEVSSYESSETESLSSEESSEEPSSQIIYGDNNIYRVTGQFAGSDWNTLDNNFIMQRVGDDDIFEFTVDMFFGLEWKISINGNWDEQIAFSGTENLTIVDEEETMRGSGEPYHNFIAKLDGNYTLNLNTEDSPRILTIVRNGEPLTINPDIDHGDWSLVGDMNDWTTSDTTYSFVHDEELDVYIIEQFDAWPGIQFKIVSSSFGWGSDRGFDQVINEEEIWLNGDDDGNILILISGTYTIVFDWDTLPNGGGTILITQYSAPSNGEDSSLDD